MRISLLCISDAANIALNVSLVHFTVRQTGGWSRGWRVVQACALSSQLWVQ